MNMGFLKIVLLFLGINFKGGGEGGVSEKRHTFLFCYG